IVVEPLRHAEQVVRGALLVRQDECLAAAAMRRSPVIAPLDVGATAPLTRLQDQRPYLARLAELLLQAIVQQPLRPVQRERLDVARLRADLQAARGVMLEIVLKPLPDGPLTITQARQSRPRGAIRSGCRRCC